MWEAIGKNLLRPASRRSFEKSKLFPPFAGDLRRFAALRLGLQQLSFSEFQAMTGRADSAGVAAEFGSAYIVDRLELGRLTCWRQNKPLLCDNRWASLALRLL